MRVEGWRVDGFGPLSGFRATGIGPGLTVVAGPNESGKTTLTDFLRGVLVGYPGPRRRAPRHEPVHGGRHGGAVFLVDDAGRHIVVERFVGDRAPVVTAPGGDPSSATALAAVLAGVDQAVYRSVFAFGLAELQGLGTLAEDELKDLLFSAGVTGAGRSATAVVRTLAEERSKIVRARHAEARANRALRRLQELDRALREAQTEARRYPDLAREADTASGGVARCRQSLQDARDEEARWARTLALWPLWRRREDALAELAVPRAASTTDEDALAALEPRLASLLAQLSGYEARTERCDELAHSRTGIVDRLTEQAARLGSGWDEAGLRSLDTSIAAVDAVRAHAGELAQSAEVVALEGARLQEAQTAAAAAKGRCDLLRAASAAPRSANEVEAARRAVRAARAALVDEQNEERARAEQAAEAPGGVEEHAAAGGRRQAGRSPALPWAVVAVVAAVGACLGAAAGVPLLAVPCVAAVLVAAAGWARALRGQPAPAQHAAAHRPAPPVRTDVPADATRGGPVPATERLAQLAARLGLTPRFGATDLDELDAQLDAEWQQCGRWDAAETAFAERAAVLEGSAGALVAANARAAAAGSRWSAFAGQRGLPPTSPGGAEDLLAAAAAWVSRTEALRRVDAEIERAGGTVREFERRVAELAAAAGVAARGGPAAVLAEVQRRVDHATGARQQRRALQSTVAACDQQLAEQLGDGETSVAVRAELATGELARWEARRSAARDRLAALQGEHEDAVRAHQDLARRLDALGVSSSVARLALERASVAEELRSELQEWWVLGTAKALVSETLARYERERQPAVVARAGELFRSVTGGRYLHLVPRTERDGGRDEGIEVVDGAGRRVDASLLSRGTVEQLYLCLRLALAEVFAERAAPLPFVLDDVLVNFDPGRAREVVHALLDVAARHQVLLFTCHPHVVELVRECAGPDRPTGLVEMPADGLDAGLSAGRDSVLR